MSDFWEVRIQDIAEVLVSNVDKKSYAGQKAVVLCNYMDVYSNDYISSDLNFMESTASEAEIKKFSLRKGDVVITKDSESPFDIGIPSVVTEDIDDLVCGYHLAIIRPNLDKVDPLFLGKQLSSEKSTRYFARVAAGSTRFGLSIGSIHALPIQITSLEVQKKIGEIGLTIDNQIDATQALIDKYTAIKQGMMADLFSRGIDPETKALRPTFEEAPQLYHETPLGMLPKGWKVIELENLLDEVTSPMRSGPFGSALLKEELVSEGIPLLGIDNIFVERFKASYKRFVTERKFRELSRYAVRERDVVITIMGTVGRSCVIPESIGLALSSKHLWAMTFDKEQILPELVCWQLNHSPWAESWFRRESQGGVMDAIQSQTLKKLKLVVPSPVEQNAIYERYENLNNHIEVNQTSLDKLKLQKTGLMQDLLTGKVPVPA
jgi:type I restriction enzyme, S subunit